MSTVLYEVKGNIAILTISREKALNALNSEVLNDLDAALDAVSNVALSLFVTMAINSLKLVQLIDLALPLITILVAQMALICVFAYLIYFIFGRNYDSVMLGAGAIGFGLGATPNALVNMLSLAGKHGPSPRAWLVVSLVGAFLIDFANAFLITTMAGILY